MVGPTTGWRRWAICRHGAAPVFVTERRDRPAREHTPKVTELAVDAHWLSRNVYQTGAGALQAGCGLVSADWFDRDSRQRALRKPPATTTRWPIRHPQGYAPLRRYSEDWLGEAGMAVPAEHILLTQGASQALDLVACCVARPGEVVLVDDPGYCNLLSCLTLRGFYCDWRAVDAARPGHRRAGAAVANASAQGVFSPIPWLQNPTGASYSPATAYRVLQLASNGGCYVVEDNVSAELQAVRGQTLAAMAGLARVIYIGSFSKTLSPGLRVGFVAAAPGMIDALTHAR